MLRLSYIAAVIVLVAGTGCTPPPAPDKTVTEGIKIGELAPKNSTPRQAQFLVAASIDVHVFDLPARNVERLTDLWEALSTKSVWMTSYEAFRRNNFRVRSGKVGAWRQILDLLTQAGAQRVGTATLMVNDRDSTDWPLINMPAAGPITFFDENSLEQSAPLASGQLVLRLRAEPVPGLRGVRKLVVYPAYNPPLSSAIPELQKKLKENEVAFHAAAFAAQMGPGDLVVLAPNEYTGERLSLGGLFFNKAVPVTFLDPASSELPKKEPAVRVLILVCAGVKD